ncbi:MAG: DMT family transporter [Acidiferrobacterales bacterium]|nr:DMT family transporter [Acidiferrobacterales bacterium]
MKNSLLYVFTVLIWGSTWFAIEFQLGIVAVEVSVAYRFGLAAILMWLYCWWAKVPMKFTLNDHWYIAALALFNFSGNYVVIYWSQKYLTSAMTSIVFSTMLLMNIVNTRLFFGTKIHARVYFGALIGITGILVLFWNDLGVVEFNSESTLGLSLVLISALIASLGNMISVRNSNHGMNLFATNAWGMMYGTIFLVLVAILLGSEFILPLDFAYLSSLLFLSLFGTVIAFATYFILLRDIGPEKASYAIVLFPVVAVTLSSLFEGFQWSTNIVLGFVLVLLGNAILLTPIAKLKIRVRNLLGFNNLPAS